MAVKIGFGGLFLVAAIFGVMWYVNRKKRKEAEMKLEELQSAA